MQSRLVMAVLCIGLLSQGAAARGLNMILPAYVPAGDRYLSDLESSSKTPVMPPIVVLNVNNGDGDESTLDKDADALRARTTPSGAHVKVLGYVYTGYAKRSDADIQASVDRYLSARNGSVHFDGILFDQITRDCGPTDGSTTYRDKYRALRQYVLGKVPQGIVVDNVGTAVFDCYLAPGNDTADIFVTFEDTADHYMTDATSVNWAYGWVGGNIVQNGQYVAGTQYPSTRFCHLVYNTSRSVWPNVLKTALSRYAGYADTTDIYYTAGQLGPWEQEPSYLNLEIRYISTLKAN